MVGFDEISFWGPAYFQGASCYIVYHSVAVSNVIHFLEPLFFLGGGRGEKNLKDLGASEKPTVRVFLDPYEYMQLNGLMK